MHRPVIIAILTFGSVTAQNPKGEHDQERLLREFLPDLKSGDPPRMAKAAVGLGDADVKRAVPELRKALWGLHEMDHNTGLRPTLAVLDALVRLQATVPGKELDHLLLGHTLPAAMMLMARAPREYEEQLVRVFEESSGVRTQFCWLAAGNLLSKLRSKAFAKLLLKRMRIVINADLIRPGDEFSGRVEMGLGGGGSGTSMRYFSIRGYPPFGLYQLDKQEKKMTRKTKGRVVIAGGPVPIFGRRLVPDRTGTRIRLRNSWMNVDITSRQLEWAAILLRTTVQKLPMQGRMHFTLFYRNAAAYKRDISRLRATARGSVSALGNRLRHAGLIGKDEMVRPSIDVLIYVIDRRPSDGTELPEVKSVNVERGVPLTRKKGP